MSSQLPCPQCGSADTQRVKFTWWGGVLGPRLFNHVKCNRCGRKYNGTTGKSNTTAIILYSLAAAIIFGAISFILMFSVTLIPHVLKARRGLGLLEGLTGASASPTVLTSTDGQSQIIVPAGWKEAHGLNPRAALQAAKASDEMYIFILTRSRKDFKLPPEKFTDMTLQEFRQNLESPQVTAPTRVNVNGLEAMRYEARGTVNGINGGYVSTIIVTPKNFHQIIAYTLGSSFDKKRGELVEITETFSERATLNPTK